MNVVPSEGKLPVAVVPPAQESDMSTSMGTCGERYGSSDCSGGAHALQARAAALVYWQAACYCFRSLMVAVPWAQESALSADTRLMVLPLTLTV